MDEEKNKVTLEELWEAKWQLEKDIREAVIKFNMKTGLPVNLATAEQEDEDIDYRRVRTDVMITL